MANSLAERISEIAMKKKRRIVGLMSGSSADGVDTALVEVAGCGLDTKIKLLAFQSSTFARELQERILLTKALSGSDLYDLHLELPKVFAKAVLEVIDKAGLTPDEIDLISMHGPPAFFSMRSERPIAPSIGEGAVVAEITGITTITDLRMQDIAAGGYGAPLSPYVDWVLFCNQHKNRAFLNLGGTANVGIIPARASIEDIFGFDMGPANKLVDGVMRIITNGRHGYDHDGTIAASGKVSNKLLRLLMENPFIRQQPPKASGRANFSPQYAQEVVNWAKNMKLDDNDIVATVTEFTAEAIFYNYEQFIKPRFQIDEFILGGGGISNKTLLSLIKEKLEPIPVYLHDNFGIPSKAREAITWALLANETVLGNPSNVPQITGARRRVVLGKIIPGKL